MKGFTVSDAVYTDGSSIEGERSAGDSEAMIDQKSGEGHRVPSCEYIQQCNMYYLIWSCLE